MIYVIRKVTYMIWFMWGIFATCVRYNKAWWWDRS